MAYTNTVIRSNVGTGYLQTYLNKKTLENFEPNLLFYKMAEKGSQPAGYNTVAWAKYSKLTLTAGQAALTEGTTPSETAFTAAVVTASPSQYGLFVVVSDVLLKVDPINVLGGAATEIGHNLARIIDAVVQTEAATGTRVLYAGGATQRTGLSSTMTATASEIRKAKVKLESLSAPYFEGGMYAAVAHPFVIGDLLAETATGGFIDSSKYAAPDKIFNGELGALYGVRIVQSANVQTFTSTTTVYPTFVMGKGAIGVNDFAAVETLYSAPKATEADPLAQRATVGAKVLFATKLLQNDAIVRVESSASAV